MSGQPSMGIENTVGIRLKKAIKALGYKNVSQYIENNGLQKSTIYAIINKGRSPRSETLEPIAQTGINVNFLISGNGPILVPESGSPEEAQYKDFRSIVRDDVGQYNRKENEQMRVRRVVAELTTLSDTSLRSIMEILKSLLNLQGDDEK
ncbi:MAG: hypothetical protein ACE5IR_08405 [bacterium]